MFQGWIPDTPFFCGEAHGVVGLPFSFSFLGMLKKAASGVLAILPCSRTPCTLRASKWLRPGWTSFFEHSLPLTMRGLSGAFIGCWSEIFNRPFLDFGTGPWGKVNPKGFFCVTTKLKSFNCHAFLDHCALGRHFFY